MTEVLRAENVLLRDQLRVAREDIIRKDEHIAELVRTHHAERTRLLNIIDGFGSKLDTLLDAHLDTRTQISSQLQQINARITKAPSEAKKHGFALVKSPLESNMYELKFIAGQAKYVSKQTRRTPAEAFVFPFTENGNGIDLRNRFKERATARLTERLGEVSDPAGYPAASDILTIFALFCQSSKRKRVVSCSAVVDLTGTKCSRSKKLKTS